LVSSKNELVGGLKFRTNRNFKKSLYKFFALSTSQNDWPKILNKTGEQYYNQEIELEKLSEYKLVLEKNAEAIKKLEEAIKMNQNSVLSL
jgi:hypothetical protein